MSDIFDPNRSGMPQGENAAQETQAIPPVTPARRRRTDRNRAAYDDAAADETAENTQEASEAESAMGRTRAVPPVQPAAAQEQPPRFQSRYTPVVPGNVPSQGVPRPATLTGVTARRPAATPQGGTARRPVNAEGYTPIQPLGTARTPVRSTLEGTPAPAPRQRRPDVQAMEQRRQRSAMSMERYDQQPQQAEEEGGSGVGGGLTVIIIALLVLAALIVGMLLIPDDDPGMLGQLKRTVMAPLSGLLGGEKDNDAAPQASGFTATLAQDTAPYKIVFMLNTSSSVTAVRVVDAEGNPMPTVNPVNYPSGDSTIWMFEMILETGYEGLVQAQIQDGDVWMDTGLQQTLSIGTSAPPTISSVPVTTAPAATATPGADAALLTADSLQEPTVSPNLEANAAATETLIPATPAPTEMAEPAEPSETPAPTPVASPTPTLSVTATPTLTPTTTPAATEEPTVEPTMVPTATPVPEPTATPTPAPTPVPVATPVLEASACKAADPSIITTTRIYEGKSRVEEYERPERERVNMLPGDEYVLRQASVSTFRGTAFRQNASVGTLNDPTSMRTLWTVEAGSSAGKSRSYYGFGSKSQPVIMKYSVEVRSLMNLNEAAASQRVLKEVIIAGMDGKIYFLNLEDGTPTRDPINLGFPVNAAVTLDPLSYPVMLVGQFGKRMENKTYDIGLRYYSLADQKQLRFIDGEDGKLDRHYNNVGSFGNSTLIDRTSKTVVAVGTNGLLYTEQMDMVLNQNKVGDQMTYHFSFEDPTQVAMMSHTSKQADSRAAVESALAMYGGYAYYADMDGILRCVDVNTMTTVWAVDVGDAVHGAIALDLDKSANTLWLYVADTLDRAKKGNVSISRYNAMTGEKDWTLPVHCAVGSKKDVTHNDEVIPGAVASPVVGQNGLKDLVYYTLSSLSKTGAETVTGDGSRALNGVVIALNKATGKVVWHKAMDAYCYSSPVAVYNADGKGWLIQACSNGTLYLMDGLTGAEVATLQLPGVIEGSPAVYGSTLVVGTTGKGTSYVYGVELE